MTTDDKVQVALDMLAERVAEAKEILRIEPPYDDVNLLGYWGRAERWRDTTLRLLRRHVSRGEAEKFARIGYMVPAGRPDARHTRQWLAKQLPHLEILAGELQRRPDVVFPELTPVRESDIQLTREGLFVRNQTFDALRLVRGIVQGATRSIELIDNYVDEDTFHILTPASTTVRIAILTAPPARGKPRKPVGLTTAQRMKQQYPQFAIREMTGFHDRFLIIDDDDYYHFGASIKDLGKNAFVFSRIEEPIVIQTLRTAWKTAWSKTHPVI